jgi:uridylate kinase
MTKNLKYSRVLLKLSGEALGSSGQGIESAKLVNVVKELRVLRRLGVELALVIGAGNIWRKRNQGGGMDEVTADYLGMVATIMNALVLKQALVKSGIKTRVQSYLGTDIPGIEKINSTNAQKALKAGEVVIFASGTGKPFFTTDTAAAQQAAAVEAEVIIKAGPVDGVYSADPFKVKSAHKYGIITMREALKWNLGVMDKEAFKICANKKMPIIVCKWGRGVLANVVKGKSIGTLVTI